MAKTIEIVKKRIHNLITSSTLRRSPFFDYLILFALAFVPFWRMGYSGIWNIHDQSFSLYPVERFMNGMYLWDRFFGTGSPDVVSIQLLWPDRLLLAGLAFIGLPLSIVQRIQLILSLVLTGLGMYYLVSTVFPHPDQKSKRIACLVASLFYMMNPFIIYWMYLGVYPYFSLVALPFTFTFVFKGLKVSKQKGEWIKYAALTAFSSTVLLTFHSEVTVLIIAFFFLYAIYYLAADLYSRQLHTLTAHLKFLFVAASMSFFVNLWWLLPSIQFYGSTISSMISHSGIERVEGFCNYPMLMLQTFRLQLFRLREGPPISAPPAWLGLNEYIWSVPIVVAGLVIFCLAMLAILFRTKSREVAFLTLAVIIFLGFSNGLNPPFGPIYRWLWDQFSFFRVFTDSLKFLHIAVFGYSVLLGISAAEIHGRIRNWKTGKSVNSYFVKLFIMPRRACAFSFVILGLILGLILLNSYPLLSGNLYGVLDPVHVPRYYIEAGDWLKKQDGDFQIMVMPQIETGGVLYTWAPHSSGRFYYMVPVSISTDVFQVPVLEWVKRETPVFRSGESLAYARYVYDLILKNETKHAGKMFALLNVKYIILSDDRLESGTGEAIDTSKIKAILEMQKDIELVKTFGELYFYENKAYRETQIYGTTNYLILRPNSIVSEYDLYRELSMYETFHPSRAATFPPDFPSEQKYGHKIVYPPDQSRYTNWTMFNSCENDTDWKPFASYLSLDTTDFREGGASLKAEVADTPDWTYLFYDPLGYWNLSNVDLIRFWFKCSSEDITTYRFAVKDTQNNNYVWDFIYSNADTWRQILVNLNEPTDQSTTTPDLSKVDKIQIAVEKSAAQISNVTYWIDGIEIGKVARPNVFLSWNESGVYTSYVRVNPTRYVVYVEAEEPFVLVLSESYDLGWTARVEGTSTVLEHFPVNFYANGWYINKTGGYTVILNYKPQEYLTIGAVASTTTATILITILAVYVPLRRSRKKIRIAY